MAQAVRRWHVTAKDHVRFEANPYGTSGGQSGVESDVSFSTFVVVFMIISSVFPILVSLIYT